MATHSAFSKHSSWQFPRVVWMIVLVPIPPEAVRHLEVSKRGGRGHQSAKWRSCLDESTRCLAAGFCRLGALLTRQPHQPEGNNSRKSSLGGKGAVVGAREARRVAAATPQRMP